MNFLAPHVQKGIRNKKALPKTSKMKIFCTTSMMKTFATILTRLEPLIIFAKLSILGACESL